jgi:hypothetical protein
MPGLLRRKSSRVQGLCRSERPSAIRVISAWLFDALACTGVNRSQAVVSKGTHRLPRHSFRAERMSENTLTTAPSVSPADAPADEGKLAERGQGGCSHQSSHPPAGQGARAWRWRASAKIVKAAAGRRIWASPWRVKARQNGSHAGSVRSVGRCHWRRSGA